MNEGDRVLLTLVTGQHGAGKSTLIERLAGGGASVAHVHCDGAGTAVAGVRAALETGPRRVLVELGAEVDSTAVIAALYQAEDLMQEVWIEPSICVLDAQHFLDQLAECGVRIVGQLRAAPVVLLNKVDACEQARLVAVRREVEKINPRAWIQESVRGQLPHAVLYMRATEGEESGYSCFAYEKRDAVLDRNRLEQLLKRLPRGLFRVKGVVRTEDGTWFLDYVTGTYEMEPAPASDPRPLVFVGRGIDKGRLLSLLDRCRVAPQAAV